jgi:hypothetical protein
MMIEVPRETLYMIDKVVRTRIHEEPFIFEALINNVKQGRDDDGNLEDELNSGEAHLLERRYPRETEEEEMIRGTYNRDLTRE